MKNNTFKNTTDDLISVVVPIYNVEDYLADTLDCLASQTYVNLEVILVDDGSSDSSPAICQEFVRKDSRFVYVRQDNAGAGAARNHGIELVNGEFIMFADADDLYETNLVEELYAALLRDESDVAICRADVFLGSSGNAAARSYFDYPVSGCFRPADVAARFFQSFTCVPWDKLFRTSIVRENHLRFQTLRYSNDNYFVLMSLLLARRVTLGDEVLVHHRVGAGGSLRDKMYLSPTCDLEMLDTLRGAVARSDAASFPGLLQSLDSFTAGSVCSAFFNLSTQERKGCEEFWRRLVSKSLPEWEMQSGPIKIDNLKLRLKFRAVVGYGPERAIWAYSILGKNGLRTADAKRRRLAYLRFLVSPIFVHGSAI